MFALLLQIMKPFPVNGTTSESRDAKLAELGNVDRIPFKDTQSMPYLQACIKESLRLHPATGLPLARVVPDGGATISGTFFPAGVSVVCFIFLSVAVL